MMNILSTRWYALFSTAVSALVIVLILHISPVFAGSNLTFPAFHRQNYSFETVTIADNSLVTTKQNPSSLLNQLNLTSEQREKIKRIHHQYKQQIRKKRNSLNVLQRQLSDLMVSTEPAELVRAKNRQLVSLKEEIGVLRFESMLATREILTPSQRQKFKEIMESQLAQ